MDMENDSMKITLSDKKANEIKTKKIWTLAALIVATAWIIAGKPAIVEADTIRLQDTVQVEDAFLQSSNPSANFGTTSYVSSYNRYLFKFNLPAEVMNKQIVSAKMAVYVWNQTNYKPNQYMYLYIITSPWQEGTVTYNTTPSYNPVPTASILHMSGSANWDHTFYPAVDLTALVQGWANHTIINNGILFSNEMSVTGMGLKSSEYGNNARTYLEITTAAPNPVPVPSAILLLGSGILGFAGISRRKKS